MAVLFYLFILFVCGNNMCGAIKDYCSTNTFDDPGYGMHFTKEPNYAEFAIVGKFKGLHCCAKGYTSIEWYKDDQPYPWGLDLSALIIFPKSANQTIYTQNIRNVDSGNYTCVLRNDRGNSTLIFTHNINLRVFDKIPDDPKITYVSPNTSTSMGASLRLFCEAFGGTIDLPDAHNEAVWLEELSNGTLIEISSRVKQRKVSREEGQTFGTYLKFPNFQVEDVGTYVCVISKPGITVRKRVALREQVLALRYIDPNPFPWKQCTIILLVVCTLIISMIVLKTKYGLKVQLLLKDNYGTLEDDDGKTNDVLIAYSPKDCCLVNGVMLPILTNRSYQCVAREINDDVSSWAEEISQYAQSSRRIIVILSPAAFNDIWTSSHLYQSLKKFQLNNTTKVVYVTLKDLPVSNAEVKNSIGETLGSLVRQMNIIEWNRSNDGNFWFRICKELPPKRQNCDLSAPEIGIQPRHRLSSERSIDNLMVV